MRTLMSIILFIISIIIVTISMYYYVYRGFVVPKENNEKIITKTELKKEVIEEKKYNIKTLIYGQSLKEKNWLSNIIINFLENKKDISYDIELSLKEEWINQFNNIFNKKIIQKWTTNKINIKITQTNTDLEQIEISGILNNSDFNITWLYNNVDKTILITYFKINWLLTLVDNEWYNNYIKDWFDIKYKDILGKRINIELWIEKIIDFYIPESNKQDVVSIINWIESFLNVNEWQESFSFIFSEEKYDTYNNVVEFIKTNENLARGEKIKAKDEVLNMIKKLDNTSIYIDWNNIFVKNNKSLFFFDFDIKIKKKNEEDYIKIDETIIENDFTYNVEEIIDIFQTKNKLLVKYLNWWDLSFLLP